MSDFILFMWKPLLACVVLTGIHGYLGLHVIERKVIFVDLALAQMAALGATFAVCFGWNLHGPGTYWPSLATTVLGAVLFSLARTRKEKIPLEAIIGIVYAVSAGLAILILSRTAEGDEHIRFMLIGNILLVSAHDIVKMALLYAGVGILHWCFRRNFFLISIQPEKAFRQGVSVKTWDLVFYLTFGLVVTSSVQIAGVLLVFSFLIVPAVIAILFTDSLSLRLLWGWSVGIVTSFIGIALSYFFDLPTGATIVCAFGAVLLISAWVKRLFLLRR